MDRPTYQRLSRTPHSEQYQLLVHGERLGHLDLHFAASDVFGTLVLERDVDEDSIRELIEHIDDDLVVSSEVANDDFYVRVFSGRELTEFSRDFLQDEMVLDGSDEFEDV